MVENLGATATLNSSNVGTITATHNNTAAIIAQILPGNGQTLMAIYTIPSNKIGYLHSINITTEITADVNVRLRYRDQGQPIRTGGQIDIDGAHPYIDKIDPPQPLSPGADIWIEAQCDATSGGVSARFAIRLEDI